MSKERAKVVIEWERLVAEKKNVGRPCEVCGRRAGYAPRNRHGEPDLCPETPLGLVRPCRECGLFACPDCLHESECCEKAGKEV